ncbi:hypothetical protein [Nocardioides sp.]|uniref:hypothetical protein n=1 Tax=Nocardioides sp. TaxID=35761 RepID=UPI0027357AD6|nr:hypothetical protein [Nocardioides sp.]MDP3893953.1 hypothetical protein [Nocardioides sp.]
MIARAPWHRRLAVLGLASALALSSCSTDPDEADAEATATPTPSVTATTNNTQFELPDGVTLTAEGSELELGDTATVAWEPRAGVVGVLDITVEQIEQATLKDFAGWTLDKATRQSTPYFVRGQVENAGDIDLGGLPVPLYIVDGTNTLIQASSFASKFKPCPSGPLPAKFAPGKQREVCLVYLAPEQGELEAVSFRPTQEFDPITWTGQIDERGKKKDGKKGKKKDGKKKQQQDEPADESAEGDTD